MSGWWEKQIGRADQLAVESSGSGELLAFYAQLLRAQREIYEFLRRRKNWLPSGNIESDVPVILDAFPVLLKTVETCGPETLAAEAHGLSETNDDLDRKSTRLNSSHANISYAVFCLKKKNK